MSTIQANESSLVGIPEFQLIANLLSPVKQDVHKIKFSKSTDWRKFLSIARFHEVTSLLHYQSKSLLHSFPQEIASTLTLDFYQNITRNKIKLEELYRIIHLLNQEKTFPVLSTTTSSLSSS